MFLVGAVDGPRKRKRTNWENPRANQEDPEKNGNPPSLLNPFSVHSPKEEQIYLLDLGGLGGSFPCFPQKTDKQNVVNFWGRGWVSGLGGDQTSLGNDVLTRDFFLNYGLVLRRPRSRSKNCSHCNFQDFHAKENQASSINLGPDRKSAEVGSK